MDLVMVIKTKNTVSPAELRVLEVLWDKSPQSTHEIVEKLAKVQNWHSRTIKTLISRLVKKMFVGYEQEKNHYLYFPLIKKQEYQKKISGNFIHRVFGGKISPLVAYFAKQGKISNEDIQELKKILDELENK
jgi:BlaI family penicillinase repressor